MSIENMTEQEQKETLLEAKILEKLDHPNIIKFREVFIAKKPKYTLNIVTDYADGGDLQTKIKNQKGKYFSETQILDWFTQICLALKHIHDKKILHRDLKSQNIFLTENGIVKIGDFGIAKCLECTWQKAMTVVGTPYYLSPEIVNNKPYSFKSDIWSLGVLLYEMAALKMPFDANSLPMLSLKIIKGNYNPLPNNFSKDMRNLVAALLVVDVNKRPNINDILSKIY
jgi:NIMA (never in mitosis gene a)-related kinase